MSSIPFKLHCQIVLQSIHRHSFEWTVALHATTQVLWFCQPSWITMESTKSSKPDRILSNGPAITTKRTHSSRPIPLQFRSQVCIALLNTALACVDLRFKSPIYLNREIALSGLWSLAVAVHKRRPTIQSELILSQIYTSSSSSP